VETIKISKYEQDTKEKFSFLEERDFSYSIDNNHITYKKGDDSIELWFDFYGFEISCLICKGKQRIHLFNAVRYFGFNTYGFYHMYHSYKQIPEVIEQYAGFVKELVIDKDIFNEDVFVKVYEQNEADRLSRNK